MERSFRGFRCLSSDGSSQRRCDVPAIIRRQLLRNQHLLWSAGVDVLIGVRYEPHPAVSSDCAKGVSTCHLQLRSIGQQGMRRCAVVSSCRAGAGIYSSPAYSQARDLVVFGAGDGVVYALAASTGAAIPRACVHAVLCMVWVAVAGRRSRTRSVWRHSCQWRVRLAKVELHSVHVWKRRPCVPCHRRLGSCRHCRGQHAVWHQRHRRDGTVQPDVAVI